MSTNADYPRTLIVGASFNEKSGSGTFLGKLFSGWPVERLASVDGGNARDLDWSRCRLHYRAGELRFPLRRLARFLCSAGEPGPVSPPESDEPVVQPSQLSGRMPSFFSLARCVWPAIRRLTGGGEFFFCDVPSVQLLSWINKFQPQVIYGHCSSLHSVRFLRLMQQALKLPLVLHVMDDWAETKYREGWLARCFRLRYEREFYNLVRSADVVIAICQEMAEEYERRYQRPVLWLPMPAKVDDYQAVARAEWTVGHPFRIRYGGRVGWAISESLVDLAQVVHALRQDGVDLVFDLATFEPEAVPASCFASDGVNVQSPAPLADLPRLQAEVDVLFVCYDFDPRSFAQARYSMPSKLADCMASGTPILVYGPEGLPVVEYARRDGWGLVVDKRDLVALKAAVCELVGSVSLREQLGRRAKRLAAERHDVKIVSESFREMLEKAKKSRKRKTESR